MAAVATPVTTVMIHPHLYVSLSDAVRARPALSPCRRSEKAVRAWR